MHQATSCLSQNKNKNTYRKYFQTKTYGYTKVTYNNIKRYIKLMYTAKNPRRYFNNNEQFITNTATTTPKTSIPLECNG